MNSPLPLRGERPQRGRPLHSAAERALLVELIAFLNHRQTATMAQVDAHVRRAAVADDGIAARHQRAFERIEHLARRIGQLATTVGHAQSLKQTLQHWTPPRRARDPIPLRPWPVEPAIPRPGTSKVLLRVEDLSKEIGGADILDAISFDIHEHEILGLIGPNGAGKTTLIECLANLRPRTSGTFYESDEAPPAWDPTKLLFYLPNGVAPYAELHTLEVLTHFGRLFEVEPRRWEQIVVDDLSLRPVLQKKVGALSKGNLQRLLIALALMSPQPLLLLDEPFDGLDLHQTHAMMDILRALRAAGRTLLLCIHQLADAERICDRLLLLSGGRLVAIGTLAELQLQAGLPGASLERVFLALTG